jgi:hypothetical protein
MVPGGGFEPPTRGFSIHCFSAEIGHAEKQIKVVASPRFEPYILIRSIVNSRWFRAPATSNLTRNFNNLRVFLCLQYIHQNQRG